MLTTLTSPRRRVRTKSHRKTKGRKRQIVKTHGNKNRHTGSCEGNPGPSARLSDLQRRPSPDLKPGAKSGGSVRSDRRNKFWSPGINAAPATPASKASAPSVVTRGPCRSADRPNSLHSPSQGEIRSGAHGRRLVKGQINGRESGRRRAPLAAGPRLRHEDVQSYPIPGGGDRRPEGPRTGDAGSDRLRTVDSPTSPKLAAMPDQTYPPKPKAPP